MSNYLAQFPLPLVVFPGELLPLHIFEPRYRQLIQDAESDQITFGITPHLNDRLQFVGTELSLHDIVQRYADGRLDIRARAHGRYRLLQFNQNMVGKPYAGALIEPYEGEEASDIGLAKEVLYMVRDLYDLLHIERELPTDPMAVRTFALGHYVGLSIHQEYELLCLSDEQARLAYLQEHLSHLLPRIRSIQQLKERISENGHFKHIQPPEL